MQKLSEKLLSHFEREDINYLSQPNPDSSLDYAYYLPFGGRNCNVTCRVIVNDQDRTFRVIASSGIRVPRGAVSRLTEQMARVNYSLLQGCFCLDPNDRELCYVLSVSLRDAEPTNDYIECALASAVAIYDGSFYKFARLIYGKPQPYSKSSAPPEEPSPEQMQQVVEKLLSDDVAKEQSGEECRERRGQPNPEVPVKRKRGRPRKSPKPE